MKKYEVTIEESVSYRVLIRADSEDEARETGLEAHNDGLSSEVDSTSPEVTDVSTVR